MRMVGISTPFHSQDRDGTPLVSIRLTNKARRVHLSAGSHEKVTTALGVNLDWSLDTTGCPHVVARSRTTRQSVYVARFLLGTVPRGRIHYADGNHFNLREENLRAGLAASSRAPKVLPEPKHDRVYRADKDGTRVVGVEVEGAKKRAWLERAAYEALVAEVGVKPWFVHRCDDGVKRVCFESLAPGIFIPVSRIITGGNGVTDIVPKDASLLNLRAANL